MIKRGICLLLCLLMLTPSVLAAEKADRLPPALLFSQTQTDREYINSQCYSQRMYPLTANEAIDAEMAALIDNMHDRALPSLSRQIGASKDPTYLTVGADITRTGTKWLSFLSIARIDHDRRQTYVDFDARVYDMETGRRIRLGDIFPTDSEAWELLGNAVRIQLNDYFLGTEADPEVLKALCTPNVLAQTPFTLTPASLRLHYRADALYPGREQLLHVCLYHNELRDMMTPEARTQTDNSMYKMCALTFDDGVSHYDTSAVAHKLRMCGAEATFFVVGRTIHQNQDMLAANHDAGHLIASHNYLHVYDGLSDRAILEWKEKFDRAMNEAIGIRPTMMRAPGGKEGPYCRAGVDMPVIHWSIEPCDAGSDKVEKIIHYVTINTHDGDIVLMHDLNSYAREYVPQIIKNLTAHGFLCVTVAELYAAHGKSLEPNRIYLGGEDVFE